MLELKNEREAEQERLSNLEQLRQRRYELENAQIRLEKLCTTVRRNLGKFTTCDKRLALDALDIKVIITADCVEIQGIVAAEYVTTEQTWA